MEQDEKIVEKLIAEMEALTEFQKEAVSWLVCHLHLAELLCAQGEPLDEDMFEKEVARAVRTRDYAYYGLLFYQRASREQGRENGEKPTGDPCTGR